MTLWFLLAMMTGAAIFAVLWPLGRRTQTPAGGNDLRVYRDQIDEVERDRTAGRIGEAEAEAARIEVSRRLLAAAEQPAAPVTSAPWRKRTVALVALILLPIGSAALYLLLGSPFVPAQPLSARITEPESAPIAQLVAQVEAHLEKNPQDGRGWEVLAPVYQRMGRYDEAARAWRNTVIYSGATAERDANLGEALTVAAKGVVTADAKQAFERAVALDPRQAKARYFLGLSAQQDGRTEEAATIWRELLTSAPPDASWIGFVREELARIGQAAAPARGPTAEQMESAAEMDPQQRQQMIAGMVEGLAERLKNDRSDFEGWLRLVRAYSVLGERDKARSAAADARRAIGSDTEKLRRLDELVKGLGLEG